MHRTVSFIAGSKQKGRCEGAREKQKFVSMSDPMIDWRKVFDMLSVIRQILEIVSAKSLPEKWDQKLDHRGASFFFLLIFLFFKRQMLCSKIRSGIVGRKRVQIN